MRPFYMAEPPKSRKRPAISKPIDVVGTGLGGLDGEKLYYNVVQDYLPNSEADAAEVRGRFLNVRRGDIVLHLGQAENNLVYVKLMNMLGEGLVPARCLEVNSELSTRVESAEAARAPSARRGTQVRFTAAGTSCWCCVTCCGIRESRVWYRIECMLRSGYQRTLCRYYQDFYWLHVGLIGRLQQLGLGVDLSQLPKLPAPAGNMMKNSNAEVRMESFNKYLRELFESTRIPAHVRDSLIVDQWLAPRMGDLLRTPRGAIFRVSEPAEGSGSQLVWEAISEEEADALVPQTLSLEKPPWVSSDSNSSLTTLARSLSAVVSGVSQAGQKAPQLATSAPSTPVFKSRSLFQSLSPSIPSLSTTKESGAHTPLMSETSSCASTPLTSPSSGHSSPTDTGPAPHLPIKMKVFYGEDVYAVICTWDRINDYGSLLHFIKQRLAKELPENACHFQLSRRLCHGPKNVSAGKSHEETLLCASNYKKVMSEFEAADAAYTAKHAHSGIGIAFNTTEPVQTTQIASGNAHLGDQAPGKLNILVKVISL
ncbi:AaceriAGL313Cp [[Ashbya] aceris (nom. inval.)]|nr:AaceriAGL313Cp [[Ashbya] aceris (nom. inval.)]